MKILALILSIIQKLLETIEVQRKRQEQQHHEERVNDIQDDPVNWFDDYFNGVRDNGVPDDASEANEAETGKYSADERGRDDTQQG